MAKSPQALIAQLISEDPGMTSVLSGATSAQNASTMPMDGDSGMAMIEINANDDCLEEPEGYTEQELKLAKRFVELVGGADRARDLIDKVDECEDCLQLIDDDESEARAADEIGKMADLMPGLPDLPTAVRSATNFSSLYNPNATTGVM